LLISIKFSAKLRIISGEGLLGKIIIQQLINISGLGIFLKNNIIIFLEIFH